MDIKLMLAIASVFTLLSISLLPGTALAQDRFSFSAEGAIVADSQTGLQWMRCALGQTWNASNSSCDGDASKFGWGSALEAKAEVGGYSDWRLPTRVELSSLVYCSSGQREGFKTSGIYAGNGGTCQGQYERPTIDQAAFPNTPHKEAYWTSERLENVPVHHAWVVGFRTGYVNDIAQSSPYPHVRLVRKP